MRVFFTLCKECFCAFIAIVSLLVLSVFASYDFFTVKVVVFVLDALLLVFIIYQGKKDSKTMEGFSFLIVCHNLVEDFVVNKFELNKDGTVSFSYIQPVKKEIKNKTNIYMGNDEPEFEVIKMCEKYSYIYDIKREKKFSVYELKKIFLEQRQ